MICATTDLPSDDCIVKEATRAHAEVFRGSELDVLSRYYGAATAHCVDVIMRITADCPLLSPSLCRAVLNERERVKADYASNVDPRTFPKGVDCEAFTFALLMQANTHAKFNEREHVTTWMRKRKGIVRANVRSPWPLEGRLTLDTEDDYRTLCAHFGHEPHEKRKAA